MNQALKSTLLVILFFLPLRSWGVNVALSSFPANLNPFFATDANSQNINRLIHISLTDFSRQMTFDCKACVSYEESIDQEQRHHIDFVLRDDLTFWNGKKVESDDVINSIKYYQDEEKIKSIFRFAFKKIIEAKKISKNRIRLTYEKYHPENLSNLSLLKIIKVTGAIDKSSIENIVGAGEFEPSFVGINEVVLKRRKDELFVKFKVVKDETTLALKIINKEINLNLANLSARKMKWIEDKGKGFIVKKASDGSNYAYVGFNHRSPLLKEKEMRRVLSLLVPREDIVEKKLLNTASVASSLFSPAFKGLYLREYLQNDKKLAKSLLKKLGYEKQNKYWFKNGKKISLSMKISNNRSVLEIAETIVSYWNEFGLDIKLYPMEWGSFMRSVKSGQFDLMMGRWVGFTGPDMMEYVFHSKRVPPKGANRGHFVNVEVDAALDLASAQVNQEKSLFFYKKANQLINDNFAYINLWHPKVVWLHQNCLSLPALYPNGSFEPLKDMRSSCD